MLINSFVDFTNPFSVNVARVLFAVVSAVTYLIYLRVGQQVEANKDANSAAPVWGKKQAGPMAAITSLMGGGAPAAEDPTGGWTKTTIYEIEKAKVDSGGSVFGSIFPLVMSMQMNIHLPLAMNVVTQPVTLYEEPIIQKYLLGSTAPALYGEVTTDPTTGAAPAVAAGTAGAVVPAAPGAPRAGAATDVAMEEAVLSTWESKETVDIAAFEALVKAGKDINHAIPGSRWTALHVVAGNSTYGVSDVSRVLVLGADPTRLDEDGWTPLHWAAYHDAKAAVDAICGAYDDTAAAAKSSGKSRRIGGLPDLGELLTTLDAKGRSAIDLAVSEGNAGAEAALRAHAARAGVRHRESSPDAARTAAGSKVGAVDEDDAEDGIFFGEEPAAAAAMASNGSSGGARQRHAK